MQGMVLDEVDVLLGGVHAFDEEVMPIVEHVQGKLQLVLVSATLPAPVYTRLREVCPDLVAATGPNLHHIAAGAPCAAWRLICQHGGTLAGVFAYAGTLVLEASVQDMWFDCSCGQS
jgi:hypothetical protein